ncbi:hypothetical protein DRQ17_04865 [bacterium]|nr:MAG: hypothetical protein DRQ17_04865 [bacterium]
MKRGQVWSVDFAMSFVIFISITLFAFFMFAYINQHTSEHNEIKDIQYLAVSLSDTLVRSRGLPEAWTPSNVNVIGFVTDCDTFCDNILNKTKVMNFISMDYETIRDLLTTKKYHFYFDLRYANNSLINVGGTPVQKGFYPSVTTVTVPVQRFVLFDGKIAKMNFIIWR